MSEPLGGLELYIVSEPPDKFYNQQGGKYDHFKVKIGLRGSSNHEALHMRERLPIEVRLLYESQKVVENQGILQLMKPPELLLNTRRGELRVRINEVSKNHQSQNFRLSIGVGRVELRAGVRPFPSVRSALTRPIKVLSKRARSRRKAQGGGTKRTAPRPAAAAVAASQPPTRKRRRAAGAPSAAAVAARQDDLRDMASWTSTAMALLRRLEWIEVGYEKRMDGPGREFADKTRPIQRCPCCGCVQFVDSPGIHAADCDLARLMQTYADISPGRFHPLATLSYAVRSLEANPSAAATPIRGPFQTPAPAVPHLVDDALAAVALASAATQRVAAPATAQRAAAASAAPKASANGTPTTTAAAQLALPVPAASPAAPRLGRASVLARRAAVSAAPRGDPAAVVPSSGLRGAARATPPSTAPSSLDMFSRGSTDNNMGNWSLGTFNPSRSFGLGGSGTTPDLSDVGTAELNVAGLISRPFLSYGYPAVNAHGEPLGFYTGRTMPFKPLSTSGATPAQRAQLRTLAARLHAAIGTKQAADSSDDAPRMYMIGAPDSYPTLSTMKAALMPQTDGVQ